MFINDSIYSKLNVTSVFDMSGVDHFIFYFLTSFFSNMAQDRRAVVKNVDMSDEMQTDAIDIATQALDRFNIEKDIAAYIKKEFDKKYNPTWHCVVGRSFGSFVTHETKHFVYFYIGQVAVQLWKCG